MEVCNDSGQAVDEERLCSSLAVFFDTPDLTSLDVESLQGLTPEQLVRLVVQQQAIIERQQVLIEQLQQEIERLKLQQQNNSQISSKPPRTDLIQKSEKPKTNSVAASVEKRKPGGQPGHAGKTRKGFGRVEPLGSVASLLMSPLWRGSFFRGDSDCAKTAGSQTGGATNRSSRVSPSNMPVYPMWSKGECASCC